MIFSPEAPRLGSCLSLQEASGTVWTPLLRHGCSFPPEIFRQVMLNLIRNPNINSSHLFRADISLDTPFSADLEHQEDTFQRIVHFRDFNLTKVMLRKMIPRNALLDKALDQTCMFYEQKNNAKVLSLVSYIPHINCASESPFYHPAVRGIGFLHEFDEESKAGQISIHYLFFESDPRSTKLERTAHHLLAVLHKHGEGTVAGYVKRVQHDVVLPQAAVQNTYARLKAKYARTLCQGWVESTDPSKHVFEDLGIAAFLIELWVEMYKNQPFPGFVDIGCGNGLLVHILLEEGYAGWGFDARKRKSWSEWSLKAQDNLKQMVLIPSIISNKSQSKQSTLPILCVQKEPLQSQSQFESSSSPVLDEEQQQSQEHQSSAEIGIHDGVFPDGTFIISNHADELTPWTPILATLSSSPFIVIPCCSHSLSGSRFRAPPPKYASAPTSAFASLVAWVSNIAEDCGWEVEREMLRIPSTRNTALIGRRRLFGNNEFDIVALVQNYGGAAGWEDNALKLVKSAIRGH